MSWRRNITHGSSTDNVGRISSDVLGYIVGGTTGAVAADALWEKYAHSGKREHGGDAAADSGNKRQRVGEYEPDLPYPELSHESDMSLKRKRSMGGRRGYKKKRRQLKMRNKKMKKKATKITLANKIKNASEAGPVYKQYKKRVVLRKHKLPRVSRHFRRAVESALRPKEIFGSFELTYCNAGFDLATMSTNRQSYFAGAHIENIDGSFSFNLDFFVAALDKMFYGNTAAFGSGWQNPQNHGNYSNQQFRIVNSYDEFYYKNNSSRTIILKIFECKPKKFGGCNIVTPGTLESYDDQGVLQGNNEAIVAPDYYWAVSNLADFNQGWSNNGLGNALSATQLGADPTQSKNFNKLWDTSVTEVHLMPAQEYKYRLQGPSDVEVDLAKTFQNYLWQNIQKYTRCILNVIQVDLTETTLSGTARTVPQGHGGSLAIHPYLSMERRNHCRLSMPEQAGATGVSTTATAFSRRKEVIVRGIANDSVLGTQDEITFENPIASAQ